MGAGCRFERMDPAAITISAAILAINDLSHKGNVGGLCNRDTEGGKSLELVPVHE